MTFTPTTAGPEVGQAAPDFALSDQHGQEVRLSDYRGRTVVLVFFPFAFSPTCTDEMCVLRDEAAGFGDGDVVTLAVSCDPGASLKAFSAAENLTHPLLSDFWPHGAVCEAYGVFWAVRGFALRGTFIIDGEGVVRWKVVNGPGDARSTDDYRAALAALTPA